MLYKMINNNSVSTGLILLTPTVRYYVKLRVINAKFADLNVFLRYIDLLLKNIVFTECTSFLCYQNTRNITRMLYCENNIRSCNDLIINACFPHML